MDNKELLLSSKSKLKMTHEVTIFYSAKLGAVGFSTAVNGNKNGNINPSTFEGQHIYACDALIGVGVRVQLANKASNSIIVTRLDTGDSTECIYKGLSESQTGRHDYFSDEASDLFFGQEDANKAIPINMTPSVGGLNSFSRCKSFIKENLQ